MIINKWDSSDNKVKNYQSLRSFGRAKSRAPVLKALYLLIMVSTYDTTTHLLEISFPDKKNCYLLISNAFTHPKSIKENGYFEICQLADVQLHLISKHYLEEVLNEPFWHVKEIAVMQEPPFGNVLYSGNVVESIDVLVMRDVNEKPVLSGGMSKSEFVEEFIRDGGELYGKYSENRKEARHLPIESYIATYIPTSAYTDVFDMNRYFNRYTRYDYDKKVWVSPA